MSYTGGQNQVVEGNRNVLAVRVAYKNALAVFVDPDDVTQNDGCIFLVAEEIAYRNPDLSRGKHRGRDLIQQRLEQIVVFAIDHHNFRWRILEGLGCRQTAKTSADDKNYRCWHTPL